MRTQTSKMLWKPVTGEGGKKGGKKTIHCSSSKKKKKKLGFGLFSPSLWTMKTNKQKNSSKRNETKLTWPMTLFYSRYSESVSLLSSRESMCTHARARTHTRAHTQLRYFPQHSVFVQQWSRFRMKQAYTFSIRNPSPQ